MSKTKFANCAGAVAFALAFPLTTLAADAPEGQLLFVAGPVVIVDAVGAERVAKKGDLIAPGERLVTGIGGMGQLKMSDGSFIGIRPDSDLKIEKLPPSGASGDGERHLHLAKGSVRTLNLEVAGKAKPLPIVVATLTGDISLRNADSESVVVPQRSGNASPGTYSRIAIGDGEIKSPGGDTRLALNSVTFVPQGGAAPRTDSGMLPDIAPKVAVVQSAQTGPGVTTPPSPLLTVGAPLVALPSVETLAPKIPMVSTVAMQPLRPPPTLKDGSIDFNTVPVAKLQTLPPATLATLPPDILGKLPAATIATLPTTTRVAISASTTAPTTTLVKFTAPLQTVLRFK